MIRILLLTAMLGITVGPLQGQENHIQPLKNLTLKLDSIVDMGIDSMAYPGAQLLVAKDGKTLVHKAYGYHTYDSLTPVELDHLYDLASITKVSSGLPVLIQLASIGKFDIDAVLKEYIPELKKSDKADISFREVLSHHAGLQPYIVFWKETLKENGEFKKNTFKQKKSKNYPIRITDSLFLHKKYKMKMQEFIKKSPVGEKGEYLYSGLVFLLMPDLIAKITQQDFEEYLYKHIYGPLGIKSLCYNPMNIFDRQMIVPTENDTFFRMLQVHGSVHDEAAAMLGGVSCNAGLFGNAESLFRLFQMYLNGGIYNKHRFMKEEVLNEFIRCQYCEEENRRGLGFDKPPIEWDEEESYVSQWASPESFGHSGFTGTFVWADPTYNLLVIFLSNRVYPTRANRKLYDLKIREKLQDAVYEALVLQ